MDSADAVRTAAPPAVSPFLSPTSGIWLLSAYGIPVRDITGLGWSADIDIEFVGGKDGATVRCAALHADLWQLSDRNSCRAGTVVTHLPFAMTPAGGAMPLAVPLVQPCRYEASPVLGAGLERAVVANEPARAAANAGVPVAVPIVIVSEMQDFVLWSCREAHRAANGASPRPVVCVGVETVLWAADVIKDWVPRGSVAYVRASNQFARRRLAEALRDHAEVRVKEAEGLDVHALSCGELRKWRGELDPGIGLVSYKPSDSSTFVRDSMAKLGPEMFARAPGDRKVTTSFSALDRALEGGLPAGDLTIVSGGTGGRKTDFAAHLVHQACRDQRPVLVLNVELSTADWLIRVAAKESRLPWASWIGGDLDKEKLEQAREEFGAVEDALLSVWEITPIRTQVTELLGRVEEWAHLVCRDFPDRPRPLIIVDYAQPLASTDRDLRVGMRELIYGLRTVAQESLSAVVAVSSVARSNYGELENVSDKDAGTLVGLGKESGELEYAASVVLVIAPGPASGNGDVETVLVGVAKNRNGRHTRAGEWTPLRAFSWGLESRE